MQPDRTSLLESLLRPPAGPNGRNEQSLAMIRRVEAIERAKEWLRVFGQFLPPGADAPLRDVLQFTLLGLCLGFVERGLSPFVAEHLAIVPPILEDVTAVYEQFRSQGLEIRTDEFRFRAFDYGVHKAYYLDWTLYMSRECY